MKNVKSIENENQKTCIKLRFINLSILVSQHQSKQIGIIPQLRLLQREFFK